MDQTALTACRSAKGRASRDCTISRKREAVKQGGIYLLELKIGALVCHSLVANTELAGRRLLGIRLHRGGLGIVKDGLGWDLGVVGETRGGDGVAYVGGVGAHCGWARTQKRC